jgi:hypothetical protein
MRILMVVLAAVFASAAAVLAQDASPKPDGKQVILSGCLGGGPSKFVLTNVAMAAPAGNKGENPSGTPALAASYDLTPRDGLALAPHVGHRVELTGVITAAPKPGESAASDTGGRGAKLPAAQFAVSSLKMISPICLQ